MARFLIVDDALFMRNFVKNALTKNGHNVVAEAQNGREAFEKYKETNPDIVLMDITMPEVCGVQGLEMIMGFNPSANVIMCSAMGQQAYVLETIKKGAKGFVVKPFDESYLLKEIEYILKTKI